MFVSFGNASCFIALICCWLLHHFASQITDDMCLRSANFPNVFTKYCTGICTVSVCPSPSLSAFIVYMCVCVCVFSFIDAIENEEWIVVTRLARIWTESKMISATLCEQHHGAFLVIFSMLNPSAKLIYIFNKCMFEIYVTVILMYVWVRSGTNKNK